MNKTLLFALTFGSLLCSEKSFSFASMAKSKDKSLLTKKFYFADSPIYLNLEGLSFSSTSQFPLFESPPPGKERPLFPIGFNHLKASLSLDESICEKISINFSIGSTPQKNLTLQNVHLYVKDLDLGEFRLGSGSGFEGSLRSSPQNFLSGGNFLGSYCPLELIPELKNNSLGGELGGANFSGLTANKFSWLSPDPYKTGIQAAVSITPNSSLGGIKGPPDANAVHALNKVDLGFRYKVLDEENLRLSFSAFTAISSKVQLLPDSPSPSGSSERNKNSQTQEEITQEEINELNPRSPVFAYAFGTSFGLYDFDIGYEYINNMNSGKLNIPRPRRIETNDPSDSTTDPTLKRSLFYTYNPLKASAPRIHSFALSYKVNQFFKIGTGLYLIKQETGFSKEGKENFISTIGNVKVISAEFSPFKKIENIKINFGISHHSFENIISSMKLLKLPKKAGKKETIDTKPHTSFSIILGVKVTF